jgi:hypothetical protein
LEELNDTNDSLDASVAKAEEIKKQDLQKQNKNEQTKEIHNNIVNKQLSIKNPNKNKLKINFKKYLNHTESFVNNIKDHEEENQIINNKSI